jgi:hypothetical protein
MGMMVRLRACGARLDEEAKKALGCVIWIGGKADSSPFIFTSFSTAEFFVDGGGQIYFLSTRF